jgi:four helix bundle protein
MAAARTFDELKAWQRCEQLRQFISLITSRPPAIGDRDFCWQIRRSSRSATDNIAEGFGRYYPKEFHRYVQIARGEINETMNQLHRGLKDGCLTPEEYEKGMELALHAVKTTAGLQRYLNSCIPDNKKPRRP